MSDHSKTLIQVEDGIECSEYADLLTSEERRKSSGGSLPNLCLYIGTAGKELIWILVNMFRVSPSELLCRITRSFVPPFVDSYRIIYTDMLGPIIAMLTLLLILKCGQPGVSYEISKIPILCYLVGFPLATFLVGQCCGAAITFMQVMSLFGYSLYGHIVILSIPLLSNNRESSTLFMLCFCLFGGLSTLRVVLSLQGSLRVPVARLLLCTCVALVQLLSVVYLYYTYMHPSFVFGRQKLTKQA